jgi:integrase
MPRPRPPHLQRGRSRHGKPYWFVQMRRGAPKIRIPDALEYGTPEFDAAYQAAMASTPPKPQINATQNTLKWAWLLYQQSGAWEALSEATRRQRSNIMRRVLERAGSEPLSSIDAAAINDGVERRTKTPSQAKNFAQTMRQFFRWLKKQGIVDKNPCDGLELPKRPKTGGFKEWSYDEIIRYEEHWPIGTRQRVMLDVYCYTGLRRGDAARVGPGHVHIGKDGVGTIALATEKSQGRTMVHIPLLPVLKHTLSAGPTGKLSFICKEDGMPYIKESLGGVFKDACKAAGIMDKSAHGLRKAAATRAADNGATAHELMAIFGWLDIKEAEIYTRAADRKRLAARAIGKLER